MLSIKKGGGKAAACVVFHGEERGGRRPGPIYDGFVVFQRSGDRGGRKGRGEGSTCSLKGKNEESRVSTPCLF